MSGHSPRLRMRSYSLNGWMNPPFSGSVSGGKRIFREIDQIRLPVRIFTFLEEREDSLDDGLFVTTSDPERTGYSSPAPHHHKRGNLMFADGHWEKKRWQYADFQKNGGTPEALIARNQDLAWLWEHASDPE